MGFTAKLPGCFWQRRLREAKGPTKLMGVDGKAPVGAWESGGRTRVLGSILSDEMRSPRARKPPGRAWGWMLGRVANGGLRSRALPSCVLRFPSLPAVRGEDP